jgi:hypothetical protein
MITSGQVIGKLCAQVVQWLEGSSVTLWDAACIYPSL